MSCPPAFFWCPSLGAHACPTPGAFPLPLPSTVLSPTAELLIPDIEALIEVSSYREVREALKDLPAPDIADLIEGLDAAPAAIAYRVLPQDLAGDVFAEFEPETRSMLIDALGTDRARRAVLSMEVDDQARFLDELPPQVAASFVNSLSPEDRREVQAILGYPPDSVGRLMTPDYVRARADWTVAHTLDHIRRYGKDAETVHWIYVVDDRRRLLDDLHIRTLLLAEPDAVIRDLMDERFEALVATEDREEAVRALNRYDRTALPVVDSGGALLGIVTFDDVADVAEQEFTEDVHKLGGLEALDQPYLATRFAAMCKKRGGWLAGLFVMQLLTIGVMSLFDETLESAVILALFIPLIISSGGNTGTQAASLLVRALALEQVAPGQWKRVMWRELFTGLVLGSVLGVLGVVTVVGTTWTGVAETEYPWRVGFVVGSAVVGIVMWGSIAGSLLPLFLERIKVDPATSSSPLVATLMDVSGLTIYFVIAVVFLRGTVL
jgi:magnesium transporter